jgi:hypothetical protein
MAVAAAVAVAVAVAADLAVAALTTLAARAEHELGADDEAPEPLAPTGTAPRDEARLHVSPCVIATACGPNSAQLRDDLWHAGC